MTATMTSASTFDPTDLKYQVTDEFPPDKEGTWTHPKEEDGWMHSHNSLRGEMTEFKLAFEAIGDAKLESWQVQCIQRAWKCHYVHVHSHHETEDEHFAPALNKRFKYPEKLVTDHVGLVEMLDKIKAMIEALKVGDTVVELLKTWREYQDMMLPHLQEEEEIGIPLTRAYFTPKDLQPVIRKQVQERGTPEEMGSFIHFMTVDKFRNEFMAREGIPFFVWYIDFRRQHAYFLEHFVQPMDALKTGKAPEPVDTSNRCLIL